MPSGREQSQLMSPQASHLFSQTTWDHPAHWKKKHQQKEFLMKRDISPDVQGSHVQHHGPSLSYHFLFDLKGVWVTKQIYSWCSRTVSKPPSKNMTPELRGRPFVNSFRQSRSDWSWPRMCSATTLQGEDSQHSSLVRERYRPSQIGSRLSLGGNHF